MSTFSTANVSSSKGIGYNEASTLRPDGKDIMFGFGKTQDSHLVRQTLKGKNAAFDTLVTRYSGTVYGIAFAHLHNRADAEDAAQDVFLAAYKSLHTLRESAKFTPWLLTLAKNRCRSLLKRRQRETQLVNGLKPEESTRPRHEREEIHRLLHEELEGMDDDAKEILALHYFSGKKVREIAVLLSISKSAAAKRLQRARTALGERLVNSLGEELGLRSGEKKRNKRIMAAIALAPAPWQLDPSLAATAAPSSHAIAEALLVNKTLVAMVVTLLAAGAFWAATREQTPQLKPVEASAPSNNTSQPQTNVTAPPKEKQAPPLAEAQGQTKKPRGPGLIRGKLLDEKGQPVPHRKVVLIPRDEGTGAWDPYPVPPQPQTCMTDESGSFGFPGLAIAYAGQRPPWFALLATVPNESVAHTMALLEDNFPVAFEWLEMEPAGTISGHVLNENGRPIEGAMLFPWKKNGERATSALITGVATDGDGLFIFPYLPPGEWRFVVKAHGWANTLTQPIPLGTRNAQIALQQGLSLSGQIIDSASHAPTPNVKMRLATPRQAPEWWPSRAETVSDEQGLFHFSHLAPDTYELALQGPYTPTEPLKLTIQAGSDMDDVTVQAIRGATVSGTVYWQDSGAPAPNVAVYVPAQYRWDGPAVTDEEGAYILDGLPDGTHSLLAEVKRGSHQGERRQITVEAGQDIADIDFPIKNGKITVSGRVLDSQQRPVQGATVSGFGQRACIIPRTALSGPDGTFQLKGLEAASSFWLRAAKDGWVGADLYTDLTSKGMADVALTMYRPSTLLGRVRDASGKPVANLSVAAYNRDASRYSRRVPRTSKGGRFACIGLTPGNYTVHGELEGAQSRKLGSVEIGEGVELTDVAFVFEMEPGLTVSGRVTDVSGEPLDKVYVMLNGPSGGSAWTNEGGEFQVPDLKDGFYDLHTQKEGFTETRQEIAAGAEDLEIALQSAGSVTGRVLRADTGQPVADFHMALLSGARQEYQEHAVFASTNVSDAEGLFRLESQRDGEITLALQAEGFQTALTHVDIIAEEQTVLGDIRLEVAMPEEPAATAILEGIVLSNTRQPIAGAVLYLDDIPHPDRRRGRVAARSDAQGRFRIKDVSLNINRVFATHEDWSTGGQYISLRPNATEHVVIVVPAGVSIQGTMLKGGQPLSDVWVTASYYVADDRGYENKHTDSQGGFAFAGLPPGEIVVRTNRAAKRNLKQTVQLESGQNAEIDFDLLQGEAALEGTLTFNDQPVQGWLDLTIETPDGTRELSQFSTTAKGKYRLTDLPSATVTLEVRDIDPGHTVDKTSWKSLTVNTVEGMTVVQDISLQSQDKEPEHR